MKQIILPISYEHAVDMLGTLFGGASRVTEQSPDSTRVTYNMPTMTDSIHVDVTLSRAADIALATVHSAHNLASVMYLDALRDLCVWEISGSYIAHNRAERAQYWRTQAQANA